MCVRVAPSCLRVPAARSVDADLVLDLPSEHRAGEEEAYDLFATIEHIGSSPCARGCGRSLRSFIKLAFPSAPGALDFRTPDSGVMRAHPSTSTQLTVQSAPPPQDLRALHRQLPAPPRRRLGALRRRLRVPAAQHELNAAIATACMSQDVKCCCCCCCCGCRCCCC